MRRKSTGTSHGSPQKRFFNYLKTTKLGLAFEIMVPLVMVYFVLGALQHKIGGGKSSYSVNLKPPDNKKPGAASGSSSFSGSSSNSKINFNVPNALMSSDGSVTGSKIQDQQSYWQMQNKLAIAKNNVNVPPSLSNNFNKSKEYIQMNMRDSLRHSAYTNLKNKAAGGQSANSQWQFSNANNAQGYPQGGYMSIGQQNQQNPQSQLSSMRANIPDTRTFYLLPILFFDMGTNNLYKMFRQAAVASYELKRTLVIPYFHTQPTVRDLIEDESRNEVLGQEEADHKILRDPGQGKPCVGLF